MRSATLNLEEGRSSGAQPHLERKFEAATAQSFSLILVQQPSYSRVEAASADSTDEVSRRADIPLTRIEFKVKGEIRPGWKVVQELPLTLEFDDDGTYTVSDETFWLYGAGNTFRDAKQDYITNLVHYYQVLSESATDDPETQRLFAYLQNYLISI